MKPLIYCYGHSIPVLLMIMLLFTMLVVMTNHGNFAMPNLRMFFGNPFC